MKLAVVLVHYHTPDLLQGACRALVRDAEAHGLELEIVWVDNGSEPRDRQALASLPARRIDPERNLGYAGGANLGIRATTAEHVVVMNPDVEVLPGCLGYLVDALASGAAAAGPRFFWDRERLFQLPPTESVLRRDALTRALAPRSGFWKRQARRRWRRHARRHWQAQEPFSSYDLSGALLAFRRSAWEQIGPFDEGFQLYYEETEWLQRLRAARLEARFVPAAEAVHLYAQSTRTEGQAGEWFDASSQRFRRLAYGRAFNTLLEKLSRNPEPGSVENERLTGATAWLEVSPSPMGFPAAGRYFSPSVATPPELSPEIWQRLASGTYTLQCVDTAGREVGRWAVEKE